MAVPGGMADLTHRAPARSLGVGWKLAGATVGVVAVLTLGVWSAARRYETRNLHVAKEASAMMVGRLAAAGLAAPLAFADERAIEDDRG